MCGQTINTPADFHSFYKKSIEKHKIKLLLRGLEHLQLFLETLEIHSIERVDKSDVFMVNGKALGDYISFELDLYTFGFYPEDRLLEEQAHHTEKTINIIRLLCSYVAEHFTEIKEVYGY